MKTTTILFALLCVLCGPSEAAQKPNIVAITIVVPEAALSKLRAMTIELDLDDSSGKYKSVLTSPGHMREHYRLTKAKEFFAEMTESYFGSNDVYPFVTGELKQAEPEIFTLMSDLWGKLPEPPQRKADSKP